MAVCALLNACSELCRVDMDTSHTTFCDSGVCNGLQVEHFHEHSPRHSAGFRTLCRVPDTMFTAPSQLQTPTCTKAMENGNGLKSPSQRCSSIKRSHSMC